MAEKMCNLESSKGSFNETILWENPNDTASLGGNITLNDDITNYDYIKIQYKPQKNVVGYFPDLIVEPYAILNYGTTSGHFTVTTSDWIWNSNNTIVRRSVKAQASTPNIINIGGTAGAGSMPENSLIIPTKVIGIKMN